MRVDSSASSAHGHDARSLLATALETVRWLRTVRALSAHDAALITFTARWLPYGGPPPDELYVEFGLRPEQAIRRIDEALAIHDDIGQARYIKGALTAGLDALMGVLTADQHTPQPPTGG